VLKLSWLHAEQCVLTSWLCCSHPHSVIMAMLLTPTHSSKLQRAPAICLASANEAGILYTTCHGVGPPTWCTYGMRLFGTPMGCSPISPDGCAPTGLK
jgi:hypothetical protein